MTYELNRPDELCSLEANKLEAFRRLVDKHVVPEIDWYQSHKAVPRRLHRGSTVLIVILGATLPFVAGIEALWARTVTGVLGVCIAALAGLSTAFQWNRIWHVFADAQAELVSCAGNSLAVSGE